MAGPSEVSSQTTVSFTATGQNMWESGPALEYNNSFTLLSASTGNQSLDVAGLDVGGSLSAALVASIDATAGDIALDYPVSGGFVMPNSVAPGQQFTINTFDFGFENTAATVATALSADFPHLSASLDIPIEGTFSASYEGDTLLSSTFTASKSLLSATTGHSSTLSYGGLSLTLATPTGYDTTASTVASGGALLPSVTLSATTPEVVSGGVDIVQVLQNLLESDDFPNGSLLNSAINYNLADLFLEGGVAITQAFTFVPTAVDADISVPWNQSAVVPLGGSVTFTEPLNFSGGVVNPTVDYSLQGNLVNQTGIIGSLDLKLSLLSASLSIDLPALDINVTTSAGPAYTHDFPLGTTGAIYLMNPGGTGGFMLDGISAGSNTTLDIAKGTGAVSLPGGATVPGAAFTAEETALLQSEITLLQSEINSGGSGATQTNLYDPNTNSGSVIAANGKLNVELIDKTPGTYTLPIGFQAGIVEPTAGNVTLSGNATDGVLAAAPGSANVDTLVSLLNNSNALIGGQNGRTIFEVTTAYTGTIGGLRVGDTIDITNLPYSPNDIAEIVNSNTDLVVKDANNTYVEFGVDRDQDFSSLPLVLTPDGGAGTDINIGNVVSSGQTFEVSGGQHVSGIFALSGGIVLIDSGGVTTGTILNSASEIIGPGGIASDTEILFKKSQEFVLQGGTSIQAEVFSGGSAGIFGYSDLLRLDPGATMVVSGGGTAQATSIGGIESVGSAGTDKGGNVLDGGVMKVGLSGFVSGATVDPGGTEYVSAHGRSSNTFLAGGTQVVSAGGTALGTQIHDGGTLIVRAGGSAGASLQQGTEQVFGRTSFDAVQSGTVETVFAGGIASSATVDQDGTLVASSGGRVSKTTISNGGTLTIEAHGTAVSVVNGGDVNVSGVLSAYSVMAPNPDDNIFGGAVVTVFSGGTTVSASVGSESYMAVESGGVVKAPRIHDGGVLELMSGATVSSPIIFGSGAGAHGGILQIDGTTMPTAVISAFGPSYEIDLRGVTPHSGATISVTAANVLQIGENGTTYQLHFASNDKFSGDTLELSPDGAGGTELTDLGHSKLFILANDSSTYDLSADDKVINGANTQMFAGAHDTIAPGTNDTINLTHGAGTVIEEEGFAGSPTNDTVIGFAAGDHLAFSGETTGASGNEAAVIAAAQHVNGNLVLTYPDASTVTLIGVTSATTAIFTKYG